MTDWLTYEWEFRGERATFRVDMQYWELLPVLSFSKLVYVCVAPRDPLAKGFNRMEQYRFRQLRHRLIDELEGRAIHVGSVYADTLRTLYFYAAETDARLDRSGFRGLDQQELASVVAQAQTLEAAAKDPPRKRRPP